MLTITIDTALAERLVRAARAQKKSSEDAALTAIRLWVEDCEEAAQAQARFGPQGTVSEADEGFWD